MRLACRALQGTSPAGPRAAGDLVPLPDGVEGALAIEGQAPLLVRCQVEGAGHGGIRQRRRIHLQQDLAEPGELLWREDAGHAGTHAAGQRLKLAAQSGDAVRSSASAAALTGRAYLDSQLAQLLRLGRRETKAGAHAVTDQQLQGILSRARFDDGLEGLQLAWLENLRHPLAGLTSGLLLLGLKDPDRGHRRRRCATTGPSPGEGADPRSGVPIKLLQLLDLAIGEGEVLAYLG